MSRRYSPGLARADRLYDVARRLRDEARALGNAEAEEAADRALTAAFNSRSGYEAAQMGDTGGSSQAWSLRKRGAMWLKKGNNHVEVARAAIARARGEQA